MCSQAHTFWLRWNNIDIGIGANESNQQIVIIWRINFVIQTAHAGTHNSNAFVSRDAALSSLPCKKAMVYDAITICMPANTIAVCNGSHTAVTNRKSKSYSFQILTLAEFLMQNEIHKIKSSIPKFNGNNGYHPLVVESRRQFDYTRTPRSRAPLGCEHRTPWVSGHSVSTDL